MNILNLLRKKPGAVYDSKTAVMFETLSGNWHYHLGFDNPRSTLCGETSVMISGHVENWGHVGHLKEKYCKTCEKLGREFGILK